MLVLSRDELIGLLPPPQILATVEAALRAQSEGSTVMPQRLHVQWRGNTWLTMPAVSDVGFGVKIVSVAPTNRALGLPVIDGIMLLSENENGMPLALLNAAALTAQRTGAVGALGVKYLTAEDTASVGIVGCGVQGAWQAIFACAVRPIQEVFAVGRSPASFEAFAAAVSRHNPHVRVTRCWDVVELLERTNLVITATTSDTPVLPDEPARLQNKHFISVGSYKPTMQELPDSVYQLAGTLAVDSLDALHEVGDVIHPLQRNLLKAQDIFSIGECVAGERRVDTSRTTAYKSVGAAVYDLFVAKALYRAAKAQGIGREIAL